MRWKAFWRPTPVKWRKLGMAIYSSTTVLTGAAILNDNKVLALVILFIGAIGKFLTDFFEYEPTPGDKMRDFINEDRS